MHAATLLILTSVASALATELAPQGITARVERATAGQAVSIKLLGDPEGRVKAKAWIEKPDGSRVDLPPVDYQPPSPPAPSIIEGPVIPGDCGGGTLIVEILDAGTGERLSTAGSPVKF